MKNKSIKELMPQLLNYVKPHKSWFWVSLLFDILAIIFNMLIPLFSGKAIDCMVGAGQVDFHHLVQNLINIGVLTAGSSVFEWLGTYNMNVLTYKTSQSLRSAVYNKLNSVPLKYIDNTSHGDIMNTMISDVENVTDGLLEGFKAIVCGVVQILVVMGLMLVLKWQMALLVILVAPLSLLLAIKITKKSKKLYQERVNTQGIISGYSEEMIANMKIIKAFNIMSRVCGG